MRGYLKGAPGRLNNLGLGLAVMLASCVHSAPAPLSSAGGASIVFPHFFERAAIRVGAGGAPYEMDGVTLQALMVAANDLLPPGGKGQSCRDRQEAHQYRVIRQGDIIFVQIDDDDAFCGLKYLSLDTSVRYAISTDGRILRRSR